MVPSEARRLLLGQHRKLRVALDELETLANDAAAGGEAGLLRGYTIALGELLRDHNLDEERMLEPILADLDAWGPARVQRLVEHHSDEHAELRDAIEAAGSPELTEWERIKSVLALVQTLRDHMAIEERDLLSEKLLSDEVVTDGFGG